MTPLTVGVIGIVGLLILLFSGMPIGIAMGLVGFAGFAYLQSFHSAIGLVKVVPYQTFASYTLSVLPLFILMGEFAFCTGLSGDLYRAARTWIGRMPGGLAMATIGACAGFAAICGSSVAAAATLGTVALPEMKKHRYDPALATGCVAAGGTIGILIPPSISFVIYGIITEQSIGKLFVAGFVPGVLEAILYMVTIYIVTSRNPLLGPTGPGATLVEKLAEVKNTWVVLLLFVIVIGGIYLGVFTPTEAAGVGAFGVFAIGLVRRRLSWQAFKSCIAETSKTTAMCFLIILGAMLFGYFLAVSRLPFELANIISGLAINRYVILGIIILLYVVLGCIMDTLAMILLTVPIFFPLIKGLGFDPIWFGVIITMMSELGLITPPVGMNVFVIGGIAKDIPMYTIFRGIVPFAIADLFLVALLIVVPQIALFLPSMMK